jgi:excisionase family DNA binding protein
MSAMDKRLPAPWLDLSEAAHYLGVHFTTLRRWADAGQVPCIRTPGGRRRFAAADLDQFLAGLRQTPTRALTPLDAATLDAARRQLHDHSGPNADWQARFGEEQRSRFRYTGQRLLGLLIQFGGRSDAGDAFLEEGRRLAAEYGQTCCRAGMSITETVKTFLFFGHSMLSAVQQAGALHSGHDAEGLRLYQRMSDFLDSILLAVIESYCQPSTNNGTLPALPPNTGNHPSQES